MSSQLWFFYFKLTNLTTQVQFGLFEVHLPGAKNILILFYKSFCVKSEVPKFKSIPTEEIKYLAPYLSLILKRTVKSIQKQI